MSLSELDLFELYRYLLAFLVGIYSTVKTAAFLWRWLGPAGESQLGSPLLYRYFMTLLLRMRLRRFAYELAVIGGLCAVFLLLVTRHWY